MGGVRTQMRQSLEDWSWDVALRQRKGVWRFKSSDPVLFVFFKGLLLSLDPVPITSVLPTPCFSAWPSIRWGTSTYSFLLSL